MDEETRKKLNELIKNLEPTRENLEKMGEIKNLIKSGKIKETKVIIEDLTQKNFMSKKDNDIEDEWEEELTKKVNKETKKEEAQSEEETVIEKYPKELSNEKLESTYIGILLNTPKYISKYYILFENCFFEDEELLNIYKSILFFEGDAFASGEAKQGFNLAKDSEKFKQLKNNLTLEFKGNKENIEKVYTELSKLFVLRRSYSKEATGVLQRRIAEVTKYTLYDKMSIEEVENAVEQITITKRFKQAILNSDLTDFLKLGENNLTDGLSIPFKILNSVFKGIRKGETMAYAMPSNSGKSRFTINLAAYTAFVNKKKVLIISNEMSEEKTRLCLITTILNNPTIQEIHGQKISKTEGELLEFKYRPDDPTKVKVDKDGFILKEDGETHEEFVKRLSTVSSEFNSTIAITDWVNKEINNSIYFINITDHTNEELKNVIMNYYYKEKIEYIFYDTLKADIDHIGNAAKIKKTTTILANLAQNFEMFICSTLQLKETDTLPVNLTINDLSVSGTVKEVLDTLGLIKQIHRDNLEDYEYSLNEVDTEFFDLKKYSDPDVRYYACVVDKNRAGAKPTVVFRLNLAYNRWEELGYLRLKQSVKDRQKALNK